MSLSRVYARALYDTVIEAKGDLSAVRSDLDAFLKLLDASKDARIAIQGPIASAREKIAVIDDICSSARMNVSTLRFLSLLAKKGRLKELAHIRHALDEIRLESEGGMLGHVTSADQLGDADIRELSEAFSHKTGKKIEFVVETEPGLLAGVKVTVGGVTYDGTLRAQLNRLKESFIAEALD